MDDYDTNATRQIILTAYIFIKMKWWWFIESSLLLVDMLVWILNDGL